MEGIHIPRLEPVLFDLIIIYMNFHRLLRRSLIVEDTGIIAIRLLFMYLLIWSEDFGNPNICIFTYG